jgi:uncharacterized protein involved in outer membrane biogenesis
MKRFLIIAVVVVLVVIGGVYFLLSNLDSIVAGLIEKHGSEATGTAVAVAGVEISLGDGRATIAGLTIDSPEGYEARQAFTLGEATVDIDVESLRGEPIVIDEIRVAAPVVRAEILENGASNLQDLQENLQRYAGSMGAGSGDGGDAGGADADEAKRIRITRFVFEQGRIEADASALGLEARTLTLPSIRLDDIGGAAGARPDEIAQAVLGALTRRAAEEVAKAGLEQKAREMAEDEAEKQAQGLLDKITK